MPFDRRVGVDQAEQPVGGHRLRLALEVERRNRLDLDRVADEPVGQLSEQDIPGAGGLLEAGSDVDRVPRDEPLTGSDVPGDDLSRVHAGPVGERHTPARFQLGVQGSEGLLHLERRGHRAESIVLAELRQPEDRHDRVPDELLHGAAVVLEDSLHRLEVALEKLAQRLRVHRLGEAGRADEVREHDGDRLSHVLGCLGGGERRPTEPAQTETVRVFLATIGADLHAARVYSSKRGRNFVLSTGVFAGTTRGSE